MNCRNCDTPLARGNSRIIQSRGDTIESHIRQRECQSCKHRVWTIEVEIPPDTVHWKVCPDTFYSVPKRKAGALRIQIS